MSVGRKTGSKSLAFITSLMVLFALVIPFVGTALANHEPGQPDRLAITAGDSAPAGECNEFTVTAQEGNQFAEGETIDIQATKTDDDTTAETISFCQITGEEVLADGGGAPLTDDDDDLGGNQARIHGECLTDNQGGCTFGVTSEDASTLAVQAFFEVNDDGDTIDGDDVQSAIATKTFTAGGATAVTSVACTPTSDSNPEGTRHEFDCTARDASGNALNDVTITFDVTAGPNAEEIGPTNCGPTAGGQGTTNPDNDQVADAGECGYTDATGPNSPLGTDTITVCVNQPNQPGQPAATTGCDQGEPTTQITKTWTGPARVLDCEPETATNELGTTHTITCTVRDRQGNPVGGEVVNFSETGTGDLSNNQRTTDANGTVTVTTSTTTFDAAGTQTISARLASDASTATGTGEDADTTDECDQAAGTPTGAPAGACADDVTKTWTRPGGPAPAQCNDGVDNDNDGRIDHPNDPDCTDINDNTEQHFPGKFRVATNLTIRYDPPVFKGSVGSPRKKCQQGRTVVLKKVTPGPNRTVGRDTSNREGSWGIRKRRARGRFYAVVLRKVFTNNQGDTIVCLRDRSVTINTRN